MRRVSIVNGIINIESILFIIIWCETFQHSIDIGCWLYQNVWLQWLALQSNCIFQSQSLICLYTRLVDFVLHSNINFLFNGFTFVGYFHSFGKYFVVISSHFTSWWLDGIMLRKSNRSFLHWIYRKCMRYIWNRECHLLDKHSNPKPFICSKILFYNNKHIDLLFLYHLIGWTPAFASSRSFLFQAS